MNEERLSLGYRKSLDAYGSLSFSSKVDSMMLQTSGRQSYGLLAALLAGGLILLGLLMIYPGFLAAHTALVRTMPAAGAVVAQPPRAIRFWFNEPVERHFSRIEVFRAVLERCSLGSALTKVGCRGLAPRVRWVCIFRRHSHQAATSCNGWSLPSMRIGPRAASCLPMIHPRRPSTV